MKNSTRHIRSSLGVVHGHPVDGGRVVAALIRKVQVIHFQVAAALRLTGRAGLGRVTAQSDM